VRIHLLAPPQTQTTKAYSLDGFTIATIRFARMMKASGHHVILYGSQENEAPCDELVTILTKKDQRKLLEGSPYQYAGANNKFKLWKEANVRTIKAIASRKNPRDMICTIGGTSQKEITDAHPDLLCVEYSIGYEGCYAPHRVFQSQAWKHYIHGRLGLLDGRFFDTVIPYFFDPEEYVFKEKKEPFALFVGRLTYKKGIGIACEAAQRAGVPLKVIGHGNPSLVTHGAEFLGTLPDDERNDYIARATCLISPTLYLEPFGATAIEAQLSGTPVVCSDFGAFTETVQHGSTGFRCNYLGEFTEAIRASAKLSPAYIQHRAKTLYSLDAVRPQYDAYFARLSLMWGKGWNADFIGRP
jgi:glycosyltransferase involved in cell wall biosynthesis